MNSRFFSLRAVALLVTAVLGLPWLSDNVAAYDLFIFRPVEDKTSLWEDKTIRLYGEFFGYHLQPSTFPSFNDYSGKNDRWNIGFQNIIYITEKTPFKVQCLMHDDGARRTKFDWHFSLRHYLFENLVLFIGHDSNHDAEHQSLLNGKNYFTNRNYLGFGIPVQTRKYIIEPFTRFFHHTNQPVHLDLSGDTVKQEFGLRAAYLASERFGAHLQIVFQTSTFFSHGESFLGDLFVRFKLSDMLEVSIGAGIRRDTETSPAGKKEIFHKIYWGLALPF